MIQLQYGYGAMYLLFNESLTITKEPIKSAHGFTINVGDKVTAIGKIKRTMFDSKPGYYMEYEGTTLLNGQKIALFNCPQHNENVQCTLFEKPVHYRYAFHVVEVCGVFHCFLQGDHKGMRDIVMDDLKIVNG